MNKRKKYFVTTIKGQMMSGSFHVCSLKDGYWEFELYDHDFYDWEAEDTRDLIGKNFYTQSEILHVEFDYQRGSAE